MLEIPSVEFSIYRDIFLINWTSEDETFLYKLKYTIIFFVIFRDNKKLTNRNSVSDQSENSMMSILTAIYELLESECHLNDLLKVFELYQILKYKIILIVIGTFIKYFTYE